MESIKKIQISVICASLLLFLITMTGIFKLTLSQLGIFFLYQFILILIPGIAAALLTKIKLPLVSFFCYSYLLGFAINTIEYFGFRYFENTLPLYAIPGCILLLSAFIIIKDRKLLFSYAEDTCSKNQLITLCFLGIVLFCNIFVYSLSFIDLSVVPRDFAWWCSNAVALKLNFPPVNTYLAGTNLYYYYFPSAQIAYFSLISGLDIRSLCVPLYSLTKTIVMVGAVDFALNMLKLTNPKVKTTAFLLVLFTSGFEKWSYLIYFWRILYLPFGCDIGYAFAILYMAVIIKQFYKKTFCFNLFILSSVFWFISVGSKAPMTSILLISTGLICLYWLINKKFTTAFLYGITALLSFFYVSYKFVGLGAVIDGSSISWELTLHTIWDYGVNAFHGLITIPFRLIVMNPALLLIYILGIKCVKSINNSVKIEKDTIVLLYIFMITIISGLSLWIIIDAGGRSEGYYALATFIPIMFSIAISFKLITDNINLFTEEKIKSYKLITYRIIAVGIILFSFFSYKHNGLIKTFSKNIFTKLTYRENIEDIKPLLWIRDNSPKDSIIMADNYIIKDDEKRYYYSILTERTQYIEELDMISYTDDKLNKELNKRKKLIWDLFTNKKDALKQLKGEHINYIVSEKDVTPFFVPDKEFLEPVFENKSLIVYKVK